MKRQQGKVGIWILGFLALVVIGVVVAAKVIAPPLIKREAEAALTKEWGAEVNIGSVSVHLLPVGVTVRQIQLTDPRQPERNLAVIASAYAEPALMEMLKMDMKPILDVVDIRGIRMHQKRARPGRVHRKPAPLLKETKALAAKGLPQVKLPDPQKILESEKLETVETAERLKARISQLQQQWEALQKELPDQKKLAEYQRQLAALKKQGLNPQALAQFEQLKRQIEADRRKLADARELLAEVDRLKRELERLPKLPARDLRRLQQKYAFNAAGMNRLVQTLLGEQVAQYLQVATGWAARIRPLLEKKPQKAGPPNPALDTLVHTLRIDGQLLTGRFDAQAQNVTLNQAFYQVTTPYRIHFRHKNADKPVEIAGVADLLKPDQAQIKALLEGVGIHLKDLPLSDSPTLGLILKQAQTRLKGRADLISWEKIKGEVTANFAQVALDLVRVAEPRTQKYLRPVLEQVKDFNVTVKFSGSLHAPKIDIRSDLDRVLGKSLQRVMQQQLDGVRKQLMAELKRRAAAEYGQLGQLIGPLLEGKAQVSRLDGELEKLLKAQLQQKLEGTLPGADKLPVDLPKGLPIKF